MLCLCANEALPYSASENAQDPSAMVKSLSQSGTSDAIPKSVVLFWFAATLVEEVGKTDSNSMKQLGHTTRVLCCAAELILIRHKFHLCVLPNVDDIVPLMSNYISDTSADLKTRQEAMKCFQVS